MTNPYNVKQPVYLTDPSMRLTGGSRLIVFSFPFTPNITVTSSSDYSQYDLTHTNFQQRAFNMSGNAEISLTAPVIVRNGAEVESVLQGSQLLRAAMKMSFGLRDGDAGLPPPVLHFHAYGVYKSVPVVVKDFTWNFDNDVDYVEYGSVRMPKISNFVMSLSTTYGTKQVREQFSLADYAGGKLSKLGYI